ncbi:phage holin family protein [Sutcliffiella halmapala]
MWINVEDLQVVQAYLFGGVKLLGSLALLMFIDIVTGIFKAIKLKRLRSRNALFGYARKMLVFGVIIVANVIDNILGLNGAVAYATVLFYIANEGLSILENLAQIGVKVPTIITEKLHVIQEDKKKEEK